MESATSARDAVNSAIEAGRPVAELDVVVRANYACEWGNGDALHRELIEEVNRQRAAAATLRRLAAHLATEVIGEDTRCTVAVDDGRCPNEARAVRWEDGYADAVCELHSATAQARGAVVVDAERHNGERA